MVALTSIALKEIIDDINCKFFKSRHINWDDLEWDTDENGDSFARYQEEEFEFGNRLFLVRVDIEVFYQYGEVDFSLSNIKEVYYKEEDVLITPKQEGILLFKIHQYLKNSFNI